MSLPGQYVSDNTEGLINPQDLPRPKIKKRSHVRKKCRCPLCKRLSRRHTFEIRNLHDLGNPATGQPVEVQLRYSTHYCCKCKHHFTINTSPIAPPKSQYTNAVIDLAVRLIVDDGLPFREASWHLWQHHRVYAPFGTIKNWVSAAGEKNLLAN